MPRQAAGGRGTPRKSPARTRRAPREEAPAAGGDEEDEVDSFVEQRHRGLLDQDPGQPGGRGGRSGRGGGRPASQATPPSPGMWRTEEHQLAQPWHSEIIACSESASQW